MRAPTADTGHSWVQLTQSGGHLFRPCSPPTPLTGQAQPHSQRQGGWTRWHGERRWGQAGSGSKRRGSAVVSSWSGLLQFCLTRQAAAAHTSSKPLTDVRLGRMQTVQHGQAQTQGDRGDTEHNTEQGTRLGRWVPGDGPGFPNPGQDRKNKIRTSCKMPISWVLSFFLS